MTERPHAQPLTLAFVPGELAICRLASDDAIPAWAAAGVFFVVARTHDELSIVCDASAVPLGVRTSAGWRALYLVGTFDLAMVGVLLSIAAPLAAAAVSIMPVATFDADYILVRAQDVDRAVAALRDAGHEVLEDMR